MLPTFVIGLREGLEAVLIISIVATFLKRNRAPLRPMWLGVFAALALAVGVGVLLQAVEQSLPERGQEGMETVIGLVAVGFVTAMIVWMRTHARFMKRDLEGAASAALSNGTTAALVAMAFLAVLREGFETSVFLLATFQAATSSTSAALGAVLGIAVSVLLGIGMYAGGVRINLARFFSITSAFLILVAAGLVMFALRTAHEAGWITIGQSRTLDLSLLAPSGSVRAAVVTGVLGIPADPRVIEVLGWVCYLVPIVVLTFWPARWRPSPERMPLVRALLAGGLAIGAVALMVGVPADHQSPSTSAPIRGGGTATISVDGDHARLAVRRGATRQAVTLRRLRHSGARATWAGTPAGSTRRPATLDLASLLRYTGGRVPVGIDAGQAPGPYDAAWTDHAQVTATTYHDGLVSAGRTGSVVLTLTGGGLTSPRVVSVDPSAADGGWALTSGFTAKAHAMITASESSAHERALWRLWFPALLLVGAAALGLAAVRGRRTRERPAPPAEARANHDRTATAVPAR